MKEIEELQEKVTINEMIDVLLLDQLNAIYQQHGSQSNYYAERRDRTRFALLSRFRELEEELSKYVKAFSTLWNFYKEIDKERISLSIRAEQAEEQAERLRCCGNCINYGYDMEEDRHYCNKHIYSGKRHAGICTNNWQSDNLTRKERET